MCILFLFLITGKRGGKGGKKTESKQGSKKENSLTVPEAEITYLINCFLREIEIWQNDSADEDNTEVVDKEVR